MPLAVFPKCYLPALVVEQTMANEDFIDLVASHLDVDGLELYWPAIPPDPEGQDRLAEYASERGLPIAMMCYSPDFVSPDRKKREQEIAMQRAAIEGSARLGCKFCRVLSGQRNPAVTHADGISMVADCIGELLPFAQEQEVCLILENHYKDAHWDYPEFAQKMDDYLELLDRIPEHPFFGVNYDPSNALIAGDDPIILLEAVKGRLRTLHASDRSFAPGKSAADLAELDTEAHAGYAAILRHGVIGKGAIDYHAVFRILRDIGFNGWISIEDGDDPVRGVPNLRDSALFLRGIMTEYGIP